MELTTTGWLARAACQDEDPELFFPISDVGPGARQVAQAKAVCARCPVRQACLSYALDNGLSNGVFGGTTELERRKLVRTTAGAPAGHRAA
ncbi:MULTISPECIES: WhiB family transcriptional regulator [Amycolatopsis]|uniref:Transcriptional regulator WhiB n=2 Tax=Amycolatopsis TaxID=1813 RepID=A0A2A9FJ27_9PSEU|nr:MULTISPECIES: WhiB family transcriptional regulator [Amycolatopsis]PFG50445.1 transcription factor WhiB [Amycolatopsis sulphurea]RJQ85117.1 WhiB family transcriptional regulator [Amycolatopsis panacis]